MLFSIAAAEACRPEGDTLLPTVIMTKCLALIQRFYERRPADCETMNPISLLETIPESDDIALIRRHAPA